MFKNLKSQAKAQANRLVNSEAAQRLLHNPDVQRVVSWASETSTKVRGNLTEAKKTLAEILTLEVEDDLKHLKRRVDRLEKIDKD